MTVRQLKGRELHEGFTHDSIDSIRAELSVAYNAFFAGAAGTYTTMVQLEEKLELVKKLNRITATAECGDSGGDYCG